MSNTLRDVAESTLHTVAEFVDDAYHSIDLPRLELPKLELPKLELPTRRKGSKVPAWVLVGAAIVVIAIVVKLLSRGRRSLSTAPGMGPSMGLEDVGRTPEHRIVA